MKITKIILLTISALLAAHTCPAQPQYSDAETQKLVEAMIDAHGGWEKWHNAPAIRFDNVMYNNNAGANQFAWWVAHEVIDKSSRQVFQNWPMDDAQIGFDGEQVWSQQWRRSNMPEFMVHFFYYFVNLPWTTQEEGVVLKKTGTFRWPGTQTDLHEIRMTFSEAPGPGKTAKDYFVLYIDPKSYRLAGYQYTIGYQPMLELMNVPEHREVFGPMWRLITRYEEVDGLLFPSAFRTMPEPDGRIVGNHVILNIDIQTPFDPAQARMPVDATLEFALSD